VTIVALYLLNAYDPKSDTLYRWYLLATIIGVIGAFLGIGLIFWQTKLLRKTANAAKASADAALINARALISAERSWIMVDLHWSPGNAMRMLSSSTDSEPSTAVPIRLKYTNEGRTIAWIDQKLACFQIVKDLPEQPNFDVLQLLDAEPEWIGSKGAGHLDETLVAEKQEGVGEISVIWGVIKYRDAFGTHVTTFGFSIRPDDRFERITGFTAYNDNT
jgi:hypothetical protein